MTYLRKRLQAFATSDKVRIGGGFDVVLALNCFILTK